MTSRSDVLREVMLETGTTQSELSRLSGVRQPSISGFLSGRVDISDDQLDRLLSCMGFRLEVVRRRHALAGIGHGGDEPTTLHRHTVRSLWRPDRMTSAQWYPRRDSNPRYRLERGIEGSSDDVENH